MDSKDTGIILAAFLASVISGGGIAYQTTKQSKINLDTQHVVKVPDLDGNGLEDMIAVVGDDKIPLFAVQTSKGVQYFGIDKMQKEGNHIADYSCCLTQKNIKSAIDKIEAAK